MRSLCGESRKSIVSPAESTARTDTSSGLPPGYTSHRRARTGLADASPVGSASQNGGIVQNPARDRRMINRQPAFRHHLLEIAIAERVPEIPAHAQYDDVFSKMTATEQHRSALAHPLHPIKAATGRFATLPNNDCRSKVTIPRRIRVNAAQIKHWRATEGPPQEVYFASGTSSQ